MIETFFISVGASLVAALLLFFLGTTLSRTVRQALTAVASTFLGVDVKYVFANGTAAQNEVARALSRARCVKIFTGRGNEFQGSYYLPLFQADEGTKDIRILLPAFRQAPRGTDWIAKREEELACVDHAFGRGLLPRQIETTYEFLTKHIDTGRVTVREFDFPHLGRIIITEDYVFLTPYSRGQHGRDARVIQFGRGELYDYFDRQFDLVWEDASPVQRAHPAA